MKTGLKKTISVIACLVMLLGVIGVGVMSASAASVDDLTYEINNGEVTITSCVYYAGSELVIPETIEGYPVTSIGDKAFYNCTALTKVIIPDSVTSIGNHAFSGCTGLTSITIPDSVTCIDGTFSDCVRLTSVTIGNSVTSIGAHAFSGCIRLKSITIPDSVTSIGDYAFLYCEGLTSVTIGNSVTSIGDYAFFGCHGLTSLTIPDSVTSIGDEAFAGCDGLTSITIPDSVTSIGRSAFSGCYGLTSITVDSGNTFYLSEGNCLIETGSKTLIAGCNNSIIPDDGSVTDIAPESFSACAKLTSIDIPDGVTSIGEYAFELCTGLTSIIIGNGVTSIGEGAFEGCTELTSISIPNSVTSIGDFAFFGCGLESITVDTSNPVYHIEGNCLIETESKTLILGCNNSIIPDEGSVRSIAGGAFSDCTGLTSITIPNGVTSIPEYTFFGCTGLASITIPDSVTSIGGWAFSSCTGLTSITIPDSITSIGNYAFNKCEKITDVYFTGSEEEWNEIEIGEENDCLINATIHYNSDNPTEPNPTETEPVHEHSYNGVVTTEPTCTEDGIMTYTCSCGDSFTEKIPALGHSFTNYIYNNDATTEKDGTETAKCDRCDATDTRTASGTKIIPENPVIPEANVIKGNSADNKKTYDYRTSVTFTANVPEGGSVQWYVDGKPAGKDSTLTVKDKTGDYTVKAVVTDKNGNQTMDEEQVAIKHGFFDIIIWFFVHLFNPGKYDVKQ